MLFAVGVAGVLVRRNAIVVFMCIELMLNSVNLTLVGYAAALGDVTGQVLVFLVMAVAAAEAAEAEMAQSPLEEVLGAHLGDVFAQPLQQARHPADAVVAGQP